jgi:uncharacterized protein YgbK (DUF1537 family)
MSTAGLPPGLKIAYYGDDFTGASDTLATAAQAGLRVLLFTDVPTESQLRAAGGLDVLGIAGTTRSLAPGDMVPPLARAGRFFAELGAPVLHYKVCSTWDSSPAIGNIGCAVETLLPHVQSRWAPFVGGQPNLGRYCLFGNLFASAGLGGTVHRIDRHPTMSRHPVTPMHEADLRFHLATQGLTGMGLMPYPDYALPPATLAGRLPPDPAPDAPSTTTLFDIASPADLGVVGALIWQRAVRNRLLAVGPSTVVQVLAAHWGRRLDAAPDSFRVAPAVGPVFLLCGSLSPVTATQAARSTAFLRLQLDAQALATDTPGYRERLRADICAHLGEGRHVLATTAPSDGSGPTNGVPALALARACGTLLRAVLDAIPLKRVGVAGGDTSSYALSALDAWALGYGGALSHGVPLTRIRSDAQGMDGLEIMLKGGQMGPPDLFDLLVHGSPA